MIEKIFIEDRVADSPVTAQIVAESKLKVETVTSLHDIFEQVRRAPDPEGAAKRILVLVRNQGRFIKACPGTSHYHCCGYQILHIGSFCTMDCSYCILQAYFHPPALQLFVNYNDLMAELDSLKTKTTVTRIGTGEFTDSLIWEPLTNLNREWLIPWFAKQDRAVLELKTKTVNIQKLLSLDHNRKTILAWSLNTPEMIATQERGTASLNARLKAARTCQKAGYPVAFHFDPLVIYDGCEDDYTAVIQKLCQQVDMTDVVWVSLGTLRFMPALKKVIERRFPQSKIPYGEFITGLDNKMRYFKPLRIALYQRIVQTFQQCAPGTLLYYCMEDDDVWRSTLGFTPEEKGGIACMLDQSAIKLCGLNAAATSVQINE